MPPLIICESRATMGVLRNLAYEYLAPLTATNGQSGGFIVNEIVPRLRGNDRRVLSIDDYELRGPADQIEGNTRRYIENHSGRTFGDDEWTKIALTERQVSASKPSIFLSSSASRRGQPPKNSVLAEAVLNHKEDKLIRTYDRNPYTAEKRAALELWASQLAVAIAQASGGNVTRIEQHRPQAAS